MCGVVWVVLDELQVLHSVALDVEGTGDQIEKSHDNAEVASGHTNLAAVAKVGEERLDDQENAELKEVPWKAHHLQDVGIHHHRAHQAHNQGDPIGESNHAPGVGKSTIAILGFASRAPKRSKNNPQKFCSTN